jgi:hypothetical protein
MKRNKYLDNIGIKKHNYSNNFIKDRKIQRFIERWKYGFDFRETINMDLMFAEWLYSRLSMLKEKTMDDLNFNSVCFEGDAYTIGQAIDKILNSTTEYMCFYEWETPSGLDEHKVCEEMKKATRLWAEILPYADCVLCNKKLLEEL